jgi:hypothetical protein
MKQKTATPVPEVTSSAILHGELQHEYVTKACTVVQADAYGNNGLVGKLIAVQALVILICELYSYY